jgi:hypothetical protein
MKLKSKKRIMANIIVHATYLFIRNGFIRNGINVCVPINIRERIFIFCYDLNNKK